jgi:hypothetical protein
VQESEPPADRAPGGASLPGWRMRAVEDYKYKSRCLHQPPATAGGSDLFRVRGLPRSLLGRDKSRTLNA